MEIGIRQAELDDISEVSRLFNDYRMFYGQDSDLEGASRFIHERMSNHDSIIFIAEWIQGIKEESDAARYEQCDEIKGKGAGLVQIYPSYSSVSMGPIWILNDLYVDSNDRKQGIARKLMQAVMKQAQEHKIIRISLSTAISNQQAQALYESEGYTRDQSFMYYECSVGRENES
ncbi:GNAT family N-acetyltransferase [Paenibacillus sp. TSA_86.1]|uniref:GNAT family N-acetyltransferase n=1 Tax=Paenibacillus sp. TSA_86.1 TaxID=3415649 RepID=UPI004046735B